MCIEKEETVWKAIAQDGYDTEHSMDSLHRKQTGSYYTALDLTLAMMREMIDSLPDSEKRRLFTKTFLEPCVGTGNFVFAYLRICKELQFSKEEYAELLNNIYVCDINKNALSVYAKNLKIFASEYFDICLDEEYFLTHIGSGLLVDVDSETTRYISISDVFPASVIKGGFDFVVTNPPYKNLKAERSHYSSTELFEKDKDKYAEIGRLATSFFPNSSTGTINLYKLFVEEITSRYLAPKGIASLLIPASILSDKTCSNLRILLLKTTSIKSIRIIAEDSCYVDASQALCSILFHKGETSSNIYVDGSFSGNPTTGISIPIDDIIDESTGNAILVLNKEQYALRHKMRKHPTIKELNYIKNLRGELDLTLNKDSISPIATEYRLIRGRNVGYYKLVDLPEAEYVSDAFVNKTSKKNYIEAPRLICQQIVNMAKKRRIAFTVAPASCVLGNSCNFISVATNNDGVDMYFLLGVLNSSLIDWYFKLTSSNNHINNYEIDNFPIPVSYHKKEEISELARKMMETQDLALLPQIDKLVYEAYGVNNCEPSADEDQQVKEEICIQDQSGVLNEKKPIMTIYNSQDLLIKRFTEDISKLMPDFSETDCRRLLNGELSTSEFIKAHAITSFEADVIDGIIKKYTNLAAGCILNHTTFKLSDLDLEMIKSVPQGGSWKDIPIETVQKSKRLERITQTGGRTTLYGRIDYNQPSYTITTYFNRPGNGTYVHPVHERVLSVREAARFQCFPDSYLFYGNKTDMLKQVGNAVPVLLAYSIGKAIKEKTGCQTSVDLFSGAGGMTHGFKRAGIKAVIANDIVEPACITLKINNPEIPVICGDITDEKTKEQIVQKGLEGKADIICGGPPCQGFSMAGWRMKDDPRNQLFRHFVDIVSRVNPKVIVFENVEGILSYQNGETYRDIITLFSELGYNTEGRKLMANHYAAPQRRKRVIIICSRKDLSILPSDLFPEPITPNCDKQISAYETIFDLENVECSETAKYNSNYSSPFLDYLKDNTTIDEYFSLVKDTRGIIAPLDTAISSDDLVDPNTRKSIKQKGTNKAQGFSQISMFDLI